LGTPPAFVLSQDQTLHYRVVLIAQYCWRIAVRRRTIRFDLRKLISKLKSRVQEVQRLCSDRLKGDHRKSRSRAKALVTSFVDVLLFSFQGSVYAFVAWRLLLY
ncbi:MAG TPA: hypothetical protein VK945_10490, partial [Planococcus sp. (in: firmicutes)]|nr:hypothetical protein [Planococcus sp. (in: firmicutes)]